MGVGGFGYNLAGGSLARAVQVLWIVRPLIWQVFYYFCISDEVVCTVVIVKK
jgi:hypothetical protein